MSEWNVQNVFPKLQYPNFYSYILDMQLLKYKKKYL